MNWYILDADCNVVGPVDMIEGAEWRRGGSTNPLADRGRVAEDWLITWYQKGWFHHLGPRVSTVFLGLDHGWGDGPPIVFETMIFGGAQGGYQERYTTWDEAVEGHERACRRVTLSWLFAAQSFIMTTLPWWYAQVSERRQRLLQRMGYGTEDEG